MKKRFFTLLLSTCLSFSTVFAQEVPEVQSTILTKITATWCPNCGDWGWTFFKEIIEDNTGKATFISAHHSGDLVSSAGSALSDNFNAPYQPYFYAGNVDLGVSSGNASQKRQEVKDIVDANALVSPLANVGLEATLSPDGEIVLNYNAKFFQETEGAYYLGLYILEHEVVANQTSIGPNAVHSYVMRGAITSEDLGFLLTDGTINAEASFSGTETYTLSSSWNADNISIAGIIWEKVGETYEFVNVNEISEFGTPVSVNFISPEVLDVQLNPTLATSSTLLNINLNESSLDLNIQVYNTNGQVVKQVFEGTLNSGPTSFEIAANELGAGIYFVNIQTANGAITTKKLIVK